MNDYELLKNKYDALKERNNKLEAMMKVNAINRVVAENKKERLANDRQYKSNA